MAKYSNLTTIHTLSVGRDRTIRSGNHYLLLFITRGACYVNIDDSALFCGTEHMLLFKPQTESILHNKRGKIPLEYLAVSVSADFLTKLSDGTTDLAGALAFMPNKLALSHLKSESAMLIKNLAYQIIAMNQAPEEFGHELFIKNMYSLLILLTIRSCIESDAVLKKSRTKKLVIDDIFGYISNHLTEEITLDTLEREFFVSKYHICREFKRLTGLTVHAYIVKARLNICCKYIEQGLPINEVYHLGGFGGYNHFFRAFKKEYHMTPREYYLTPQKL